MQNFFSLAAGIQSASGEQSQENVKLSIDDVLFFAENWDLANPDHKYDVIPEIWEGKNVADFIDPEIMEVGNSENVTVAVTIAEELSFLEKLRL